MEIIRRGSLPEDKQYKSTCNNCDTLFSFTRGEARHIDDQRDGDYLVINCPVCHQPVTHGLVDRGSINYMDR